MQEPSKDSALGALEDPRKKGEDQRFDTKYLGEENSEALRGFQAFNKVKTADTEVVEEEEEEEEEGEEIEETEQERLLRAQASGKARAKERYQEVSGMRKYELNLRREIVEIKENFGEAIAEVYNKAQESEVENIGARLNAINFLYNKYVSDVNNAAKGAGKPDKKDKKEGKEEELDSKIDKLHEQFIEDVNAEINKVKDADIKELMKKKLVNERDGALVELKRKQLNLVNIIKTFMQTAGGRAVQEGSGLGPFERLYRRSPKPSVTIAPLDKVMNEGELRDVRSRLMGHQYADSAFGSVWLRGSRIEANSPIRAAHAATAAGFTEVTVETTKAKYAVSAGKQLLANGAIYAQLEPRTSKTRDVMVLQDIFNVRRQAYKSLKPTERSRLNSKTFELIVRDYSSRETVEVQKDLRTAVKFFNEAFDKSIVDEAIADLAKNNPSLYSQADENGTINQIIKIVSEERATVGTNKVTRMLKTPEVPASEFEKELKGRVQNAIEQADEQQEQDQSPGL